MPPINMIGMIYQMGGIPIMTRPLIHYFSNFLSVELHALDA